MSGFIAGFTEVALIFAGWCLILYGLGFLVGHVLNWLLYADRYHRRKAYEAYKAAASAAHNSSNTKEAGE